MGENELEMLQKETTDLMEELNKKISTLGEHSEIINKDIGRIQDCFDKIRNVPPKDRIIFEKFKKIRRNWEYNVEKIQQGYNKSFNENAGKAAAGATAGIAVAALGPSAAMGIATTFGVASTGTAISTLSGAAATNAALAWLGGGTLAAGGAGIAGGEFLLALTGPVGVGIALASVATSGFFLYRNWRTKLCLETVYKLILKRDMKTYELGIVEINERIERIKEESSIIKYAIEDIESFGVYYDKMTELQQYKLGAYKNLMEISIRLLVDPIMALQPKYTNEDLDKYNSKNRGYIKEEDKDIIISLANILYKIDIDEEDKNVFWKSLRDNKDYLKSIGREKDKFDFSYIEKAFDVLWYKQITENE